MVSPSAGSGQACRTILLSSGRAASDEFRSWCAGRPRFSKILSPDFPATKKLDLANLPSPVVLSRCSPALPVAKTGRATRVYAGFTADSRKGAGLTNLGIPAGEDCTTPLPVTPARTNRAGTREIPTMVDYENLNHMPTSMLDCEVRRRLSFAYLIYTVSSC